MHLKLYRPNDCAEAAKLRFGVPPDNSLERIDDTIDVYPFVRGHAL
jgi:hypothetical protein